jgi:hypothetical protein
MDLQALKYGYCIVNFPYRKELNQAISAAELYFQQRDNIKNEINFSVKSYDKGFSRIHGYKQLKGKEIFTFRNRIVPKILEPCIAYIEKVHLFSLFCLKKISAELKINFDSFNELFKLPVIPLNAKSSSFLNLICYEKILIDTYTNPACPEHQDLDLMTIIPKSNIPCLEVYDFIKDSWVNVELQMNDGDVVILVGEFLNFLSNGYYITAPHRVISNRDARYSLTYDLQPDPDIRVYSDNFNSLISGIPKSFAITFRDFLNSEMNQRKSINYDY